MKSIRIFIPLILALMFAGKASAQLSIVIFSEKGEKFTAYINDSPRNDKPASRVETDRPGGPTFKLRILFEDGTIPVLSKSIFNSPGSDMYYVIRNGGKGKFVLEKTTSEYVHNEDKAGTAADNSARKAENTSTETAVVESKPSGKSGKGCSNPMDEPNFIASREMISNAPFDGPKLSQCKNLADKNCLKADQIVDLIYLMSGESSRLSFAKYAYPHCWDPSNYDRVKDVLRSSSQTDMQRYIDSLKK